MEKDKNDIYEQAANWWADKIRETTDSDKISDGKINSFKKHLADLTQNEFAFNGYLTIRLAPNNILTKCLLTSNIPLNPSLKEEMKLTPHMITIYDRNGHLQSCHSI